MGQTPHGTVYLVAHMAPSRRTLRETARFSGHRPRDERAESLLTRAGNVPLLAPTRRWWENAAVFNPGVAEDDAGVIHILYRAQGRDGISRLGYARSRDGVTIDERFPEPAFEPDEHDEFEKAGVEDPRIVRMGNLFYVTYTAASRYREQNADAEHTETTDFPWRVRIGLTVTEDFRTFLRFGILLPDRDDKDGTLFPERIVSRYGLLHRLPPDIWIATSTDLRHWEQHRVVLRTRPGLWDESKVGAGPPPVRISQGWLLLYHGVDHHRVYRAGFALLDGKDPSRVLGRSLHPALEPRAPWELKGHVPRVVFPTGMVVRGDTLLVYYGAADTTVGVAQGSLRAILSSLA